MAQKTISCPHCNKLINSQVSTCPHCETNLAIAAILEGKFRPHSPKKSKEIKLSPEILVPRLGDYLIERGFLSELDLKKALAYQKENRTSSGENLLGQILLDLGMISKEELDRAVTEQIIELQSALQAANRDLEIRVKERTAELEYAVERLSELDQLKSNFLANISHELRTPLTHLRGYIQLLGEEHLGPLTPSQANAIEVMQKSEDKLGKLIEDLIQFSILERSNLALQMAEVDLLDVFREIVPPTKTKCQANNLLCNINIPKNIPHVKAEAEKLTWALLHLIDNAIKFTSEGGEVTIGARVQGREVCLFVRDTGIGIPTNRLEEIFEPFHQLDGSATRRYGGTGLGLALVQNVVRAHGSEIEVLSKEGEGAYFAFSLPIFSGND